MIYKTVLFVATTELEISGLTQILILRFRS